MTSLPGLRSMPNSPHDDTAGSSLLDVNEEALKRGLIKVPFRVVEDSPVATASANFSEV